MQVEDVTPGKGQPRKEWPLHRSLACTAALLALPVLYAYWTTR